MLDLSPLTKPSIKRRLIILITLLVLVAALVAFLNQIGAIHIFKKSRAPSASQYTKGEPAEQSTSSKLTSNQSAANPSEVSTNDNQKSTGNSGSVALVIPSGNFVSNHHPSLNGSANLVSSVCTTTPGATCRIDFMKDGVTKSLVGETTDSGGSAYWDWKLQEIDLSPGSWKITAVATLNGQTKSASDAMNLEVSQ